MCPHGPRLTPPSTAAKRSTSSNAVPRCPACSLRADLSKLRRTTAPSKTRERHYRQIADIRNPAITTASSAAAAISAAATRNEMY